MPKSYLNIDYQAMPYLSRFGALGSLFYLESCYTESERQLRHHMLKLRKNAGIDIELLKTDNSWFNEDEDQAFINVNAHSWFLKDSYQPVHIIHRDDFHIQLFNIQRVNWEGLSTLARVIGDYLLLRNSKLPDQQLNQPFNYILLDLVRMLKQLAGENPNYAVEQLKLISVYMRHLESYLNAETGSDRLFLAESRRTIENHLIKEIENKIASQRFKNHIEQVQRQLKQIAELRHTILHFALAKDAVNPHPFLEYFENPASLPMSSTKFPTLTAKACIFPNQKQIKTISSSSFSSKLDELIKTSKQLSDCDGFKLIDNLPEKIEIAYSQGLADLQSIIEFNGILNQLSSLLDQAGEVMTLIQFREQLITLLKQMEQFIQHSQKGIVDIIEANEQAYFQFIQAKRNLYWWEKIGGSKRQLIDTFITNQDNLARFAATEADLQQANHLFLQELGQIMNRLHEHASPTNQQALITKARDQIDFLLDSIYQWVNEHYLSQGLTSTSRPNLWYETNETVLEEVDAEPSIPSATNRHGFFIANQNNSSLNNNYASNTSESSHHASLFIHAGAFVVLILASSLALYWIASLFYWGEREQEEPEPVDEIDSDLKPA